jgi:hypothetical protein
MTSKEIWATAIFCGAAAASCASQPGPPALIIPAEELTKAIGKSRSTAFTTAAEITPHAPLNDQQGVRSQWRSVISFTTKNIPDATTPDEYGRALFSSAGIDDAPGELEIHLLYPQNSYIFTCQVSTFDLVAEIPDGAGGFELVRPAKYANEGRKFVTFVWPSAATTTPLVFSMRYDPESAAREPEWSVERCQINEYS